MDVVTELKAAMKATGRQGRNFHILFIGPSGAGKTSLVNLFGQFGFILEHGLAKAITDFKRYNDPQLERASNDPMVSRTSSTRSYDIKIGDVTLTITDTPGLGADSDGIGKEKENVRNIVEHLQKVGYVDCVWLVINGRTSRMTPKVKFALSEISALLPNVASNNMILCLTSAKDILSLSFDPYVLGGFFKYMIDYDKTFCMENPVCQLQKFLMLKGPIKEVEKAYKLAQEEFCRMLRTIKDFHPLPTTCFMEVYIAKQAVEREILTNTVHQYNLTQLDLLKALRAGTVKFTIISISEDEHHNTLCNYPGCYSNCCLHCPLPHSFDNEIFKNCACMGDSKSACVVCGHSYTAHYHQFVRFHWQEVNFEYNKIADQFKKDSAQALQHLSVKIEEFNELSSAKGYCQVLAIQLQIIELYQWTNESTEALECIQAALCHSLKVCHSALKSNSTENEGLHKTGKEIHDGLKNLLPIAPNPTKADERRLYEEAMTKGYVEISITKCLILGAAGVGKTHLKYLLLNKDPPQQRVSTGLADNPVRAISFSLAAVNREEDNWSVVDDDQDLMKLVGEMIGVGHVTMTMPLAKVVRDLPKVTVNMHSDRTGSVQSSAVAASPAVALDTTQQHSTVSIKEEVIHHINQCTKKRKQFGTKWIQFIDSGGQLQYHDILPLFIQGPRLSIFVINLSENLSHYPSIEYYGADGKPVSKAYRSSLSHQQIVEHCLRAMPSQDDQHLVIMVGTHRDATGSCSESIGDKNHKLKALLDAGSFFVLYNGQKMEEVIFPVNGKSPQNEDRKVAKELRQKIVSMSPEAIKMPIAWFGLEVILEKSSHDGILSLVQCQECAKRLHIDGDAFSAALHHLVQHNMFLYYPEVLPQTVFCNPQVVLSKVTELVEYHHKLCYDPDGGVATEKGQISFRDHGILSVKLLREFPKYYKEGLFSPQDLLQLLLSVRAVAEMRRGEYLMPALLPHLDSERLSKYTEQDSNLIIRPSKGCIGSGMFCCLVAQLLSPSNPRCWKVCMDGDKPLCLYRNCITFVPNQSTEIVTLVDQFSYIVVHVDEMSSGVCREIRHCIHSGIKSVCSLLKYQVQFEDAFKCTGASCKLDPSHVAVVVCEKWNCSIRNYQRGDLREDQLMWFGVAVQDVTIKVLTSLTLHEVDKELTEVIHWELLGQNLKVPDWELANVKEDITLKDMKARKRAMLKWWLENDKEASWSKLTEALKMCNYGNLAERIKSKFL